MRGVPPVEAGVDDASGDTELYGIIVWRSAVCALNVEARHEQNYAVDTEGQLEFIAGQCFSLLCIVDVFKVISQLALEGRYIDLRSYTEYDVASGVVDGQVIEGVEVVGKGGVGCEVGHLH